MRITKSFGKVVVADRLSLTVGAGDVLGMVGPNGAGKTSLFGLISGDARRRPPGEIRFAGTAVTRHAGRRPGAGSASAGPTRCRGRSGT